jgi:RND family efflux transporter MFP subunit
MNFNNSGPKLAAVLGTLLLAAGCSAQKAAPPSSDSERIPVKTVTVLPAPAFEDVVVSGLLASEKEIRLSFKTGGIIQKIFVKDGDNVLGGTLLAALNLTEVDAQVEQARQSLTKAARDLERAQHLFHDSVDTKEQLDNAATANELAQQSFDIAEYNKRYSQIRAPIAGIVVTKEMNEGELAAPGAPVFLFTGTGNLDWVLKCGISDRDWARINTGPSALVSFDAYPGVTFHGVVSQLSQGADSASGLNQVEIQVEPMGRKLATGLFGKGKISLPYTLRGWTVPIDALVEGQGDQAQVFVPQDGKAVEVAVKVLRLGNRTATVEGDFGENKSVIVQGSAYLSNGSSISVVDRS